MSALPDPQAIARYDLFKGIVAGVLAILFLIALLLSLGSSTPATDSAPGVAGGSTATPDIPATQQAAATRRAQADELPGEEPDVPGAPSINIPDIAGFSGGELPIGGNGDPNTDVLVSVDGAPVEQVSVDERGEWDTAISLDEPGEYEVVAEALDSEGVPVASSDQVTVVVSEEEQIDLVIVSPTEGTELAPGDITLAGQGPPGETVTINDNGNAVGSVTIGDDGQWQVPLTLAEGRHEVTVQTGDGDDTDTVLIDVGPAPAPPIVYADCSTGEITPEGYTVGACETLTGISERLGVSLDELLAANPQIDDPDLILIDETLAVP